MTTALHITTAKQLLDANIQEPCELVRGELRILSFGTALHGWIVGNVSVPLAEYVNQLKLGRVFGAGTGFLIARNPDSVRAPDFAFVRADRITGEVPTEFFPGPPDLAVEVLSPSNSASEIQEKTEDWLHNGCHEVWLIDPQRRTASICVFSGRGVQIETVDTLSSELLPGFTLAVAELFEKPGQA
ncbi:MAG: Uma2 family endonuclease [Planctomycetia bacterium]|nr:Uma2 family endonuclease [Planctomycetia bacterium]